ncbi:helix-turn-helix domain-containing protein [Mucilaginibacter sp.]|uniref:helix-turn-helix domain-containing protein n=1 Tax=Mucilaginibacter sp. TaxID=1882438 RepID=UPI00374C92BD
MKEYLSTDEVSKYLDVSKAYVYKLSFLNELPKYCPTGKRIWFKKTDIDEFINKGRIASNDELQAEAELRLYKRGTK